MIRVHRIPFSTNVERVALACGIKGVAVEWVDHDPGDRFALRALSAQELVPVAEFGADVVADSIAILERLEAEHPDPPLYPLEGGERALAEIFVEWFNEVWKGPPNALDVDPRPEPAEAARLGAEIAAWTERLDRLLSAGGCLLGPEPGIADVCAYPFLRYAVHRPDPADDEAFHMILNRHLAPGSHPHLDRWVERIAALPQA